MNTAIQPATNAKLPVSYERAREALQKCERIDECKGSRALGKRRAGRACARNRSAMGAVRAEGRLTISLLALWLATAGISASIIAMARRNAELEQPRRLHLTATRFRRTRSRPWEEDTQPMIEVGPHRVLIPAVCGCHMRRVETDDVIGAVELRIAFSEQGFWQRTAGGNC